MPNTFIEIVPKGFLVARGGSAKAVANVFHYRRTTTVNPLVEANVEAAFQSAVMATVLLASDVDYTQTETTVRQIEQVTNIAAPFVEAGVGALAGDRCPDYVTQSVVLITPIRGKSGRGAKRFSGIQEACTTGDALNVTGQGLWNTVKSAILAGFTDSDSNIWVPVVLSRKPPASYVHPPVVVVSNDVIACVLATRLGIMKRRRAKAA